jgi:hypothetical protein
MDESEKALGFALSSVIQLEVQSQLKDVKADLKFALERIEALSQTIVRLQNWVREMDEDF